jgi:endonuclease/exonuclease/phosphatase family metal-dependent hydrolase
VRLGTYNVLGFQGFGEGPGRPDLTREAVWIEALGRLACDVLVLQEAGPDPDRARRIARGLGMELDWLPSPGRWPGAILRVGALGAAERLLFPRQPGASVASGASGGEDGLFSRSLGILRLERADHELLGIVALHAHPTDSGLRAREADWLADRLSELAAPERPGARPLAVMGDFNSEPGEPLHRMLIALGLESVFAPGPAPRTHLNRRERTAVDHIYLSAPLRSRLVATQAVHESGFAPDAAGGWSYSDHLPVVAEIAWPDVELEPEPTGGRGVALRTCGVIDASPEEVWPVLRGGRVSRPQSIRSNEPATPIS